MRTLGQNIWDYVATLSLFSAVNNIDQIDGNLKIQKLVFLSELEGLNKNIITTHFRFFRYQYGPYSPVLADDVKTLIKQGFITTKHILTKRAQFVLDYTKDAIDSSTPARKVLTLLNEIAKKYGRRSGPWLTDLVYGLEVPVHDFNRKLMKVRDIETGFDIVVPTRTPNISKIEPFSEDLINDLKEEFAISAYDLNPENPEYKKTIRQALNRAKQAINA